MPLRDEQADILGGPILQRPEYGVFATSSEYHFLFKSATVLGLGLLVWIACARGVEHLKKHRELRYKKAMRRKHGIPDSDCRPFAVAYAAAKRAHLEREAQGQKKTTIYASDHNAPVVDQRTSPQKDACFLRRRVPETTVQLEDYQLPGKNAEVYNKKRPVVHSLNSADCYDPNPRRRVFTPELLPLGLPPLRRASRKEPLVLGDNEESRKRSFEDESDIEHEAVKKSRIDDGDLMDGDQQADWYAQYTDKSPPRAFGKPLNPQPGASYVHINGQEGSIRADDLRNEDHEFDEAMEGIDEDEVMELKGVARGKKRDRTEAGSTFGGDEEEELRNGRASHHRKRRTLLHRVGSPARRQKRDREIESPESEGVDPEASSSGRRIHRSSKKKRGKEVVHDGVSVTSAEDPRVSRDPFCGGRRVGDSWEADGVQYKVGDKGERLRLTLVRKARNKYPMPQDSQHPDRSAALEIYVETWMTDDQYEQAEGRQELAWQETSRESSGSRTPDALDSPTKHGKSLLWDSVKCSPVRRPCSQFVSYGASTRVNPFERWQTQPILSRRVASSSAIASSILPGITDSPTRPGFRGLSKWEKQDREAEAMARIRAKIEQQQKVQSSPQKAVEVSTSMAAPELGTKPLAVPTITFTPAPAAITEGKSDDSTPQSKPNVSPFSFATPSGSNDSTKGAVAVTSGTTPGFSLPSPAPTAMPSTLLSGASTTPATTSSTSTVPPFSFVKSAQIPSSTSSASPSSMMPNIFAKGSVATLQPSSTPSPSMSGSITQFQPLSTENATKPTLFSFAKPDVSSTSPSTVVTPAAANLRAPISNTISGTSRNLPTVSPTANKIETPVPPVSTSVSSSESTKPTPPLFSFLGAPSSSSTTTLPTTSASSVPKFSFGQTSTTTPFSPGPSLATATAPQPKPTFNFGQAMSSAISTAPAAAELKKPLASTSAFGTTASSKELPKPSSFGSTSAFGSSAFGLPPSSAMNPFGKSVTLDNGPSASTPPKPTTTPESTVTAAVPASDNPPLLFGGASSGSQPEGSKPTSSLGGTVGGFNSVAMFGGKSTEGKPTFTFSTSTDGPKPTSIFGANKESSKSSIFGSSVEALKPNSVLGETSKPASVFGGAAEAKPAFTFTGAAENKPSGITDPSKPSGSTTFYPFSSASPFMFGKDVPSADASTPSMQTRSAASFNFGAPSGIGSVLSQPAPTSGDSSQIIFGKPVNATPGTFDFAKPGNSSSPSALAFGKPAAQNQKQEQ